jgi:hypothetical protein
MVVPRRCDRLRDCIAAIVGKLRPSIGMSIAGLWHGFPLWLPGSPRWQWSVASVCIHRFVSMHIQAQVRRLDCQTAARPCAAPIEVFQAKEDRPCLQTSGQGIALVPLPHLPRNRGRWRADKAHGPDCSGRVSGLRRTKGVKRHAPRLAARQRGIFGLRLSQRSGRTRSSMSLAGLSRGRPWVRLA